MTTDPTANPANDGNQRYAQLPEPLRQAVIAHEKGDLQGAYPHYREFVKDNPKHPAALQLFGLLLSQLGQPEPAIALMRESLVLFPQQAEVANNLGNALAKTGRLDEAVASYLDAIRIQPKYVDALRNLGLCYVKLGRLDDAADNLERALEIRADDPQTWHSLGNLRQQQGNIEQAIEAHERALALRPDYAEAHHNLGVCLRQRQQPQKALEHYHAARKLGVDRAELHHNMGNALIDAGEAERAIAAYRAALERNPADLDTHRNLNSLLWQHEHVDEYLQSYEKALESIPQAEPLRLAYATALNQLEKSDEAARVLEAGLMQAPGSSQFKSLLAYTREGQGRRTDALAMHEAAVNSPGAEPNHLVSYARALLAYGRPDEALRQAQAGAALMPFDQRALAYLALCWRLLGDERDAVLNDYDRMVRVYELPVPAGFSNATEFNQRLVEVLDPLHIGKQHPAEQTLRGGSQTSGDLFDRREPEIGQLVMSLADCVQDYVASFPVNPEHPLFSRRKKHFDFAASWSVRLARCGFHTMHTHPLGWISSAYYVNVPDEIVDNDEHGGGIKFGEPDIDLGEQGRARRSIQPATGRLVLFPSYMWHGTVPYEADDPRMTVAFDVVPVER